MAGKKGLGMTQGSDLRDNVAGKRNNLAKSMFGDLPENIPHGVVQKAAWTDEALTGAPSYDIKDLSQKDLLPYADYLVANLLSEESLNMDLPYVILVLALHLHHPVSETFKMIPYKAGSTKLRGLELFNDFVQERAQKVAQDKAAEKLNKKGKGKKRKDKDETKSVGDDKSEGEDLSDEDDDLTESVLGLVQFSCFLSAYLLRLSVRDISQLATSWSTMITRYSRFYNDTPPSELEPPMNEKFVSSLRDMFSADPIIARTWVKHFAQAHESAEQNAHEDGVLTYLAVLPFMYSGMHAFKLFEDVVRVTMFSDRYLLTQLMHPQTNRALLAITEIYVKHWPRKNDNGQVKKVPMYVRYARVMGPQYFPELQTKSCPLLVSVLAQILAQYQKESVGGGNATKIVGISTLSPQMIRFSEKAAKCIVKEAPAQIAEHYSEAMLKAQQEMGDDSEDSGGESDDQQEEFVKKRTFKI